jgi:hypothetical protein
MIERSKVQIALAELIREKQVREKFYPRAVAEGKLSRQEADKRLQALRYAIDTLRSLLNGLPANQSTSGGE